jgi:hypothetical protein
MKKAPQGRLKRPSKSAMCFWKAVKTSGIKTPIQKRVRGVKKRLGGCFFHNIEGSPVKNAWEVKKPLTKAAFRGRQNTLFKGLNITVFPCQIDSNSQ